MRHVYECPLRWADMDSLGHINNVTYVDYLQEARIDFFRALGYHAEPGEGLIVVRTQVSYRAPLVYRRSPVRIECWVSHLSAASLTLSYEIYDETEAGRTVYLTAATVLSVFDFTADRLRRLQPGERELLQRHLEPGDQVHAIDEPAPRRTPESHYPVQVRFSDVDRYGHVNNVTYVEYLQEARICVMERMWEALRGSGSQVHVVVARLELDYRRQMTPSSTPYDAWTHVTKVGRTSMAMATEIVDPADGEVMAVGRVVLVFFDPLTQRPVEPEPEVRATVESILA